MCSSAKSNSLFHNIARVFKKLGHKGKLLHCKYQVETKCSVMTAKYDSWDMNVWELWQILPALTTKHFPQVTLKGTAGKWQHSLLLEMTLFLISLMPLKNIRQKLRKQLT